MVMIKVSQSTCVCISGKALQYDLPHAIMLGVAGKRRALVIKTSRFGPTARHKTYTLCAVG